MWGRGIGKSKKWDWCGNWRLGSEQRGWCGDGRLGNVSSGVDMGMGIWEKSGVGLVWGEFGDVRCGIGVGNGESGKREERD